MESNLIFPVSKSDYNEIKLKNKSYIVVNSDNQPTSISLNEDLFLSNIESTVECVIPVKITHIEKISDTVTIFSFIKVEKDLLNYNTML